MALFMPPSTTIHYKSAFNIQAKDGAIFTDMRIVIRNWCNGRPDIDRIGKEELSRGWFFTGDAEQHICGQCYIRTASNVGKFDYRNPEHWVFELIHDDHQDKARLWSTNIGITRESDTSIRFACLLRHGIKTTHFGPQPENPTPSVPKFMRDILGSEKIECLKFGNEINPYLYDVGVFGGLWLAKQICDKERRLPIIVYANNSAGDCSDNIENLFRKNIGNANVYVITNDNDLNDVNANIPHDHRMLPGMLRIYLRYSEFFGSGFKHKFYLERDLQERWNEIGQEITFALSQNALSFMPGELIEISQVVEKRKFDRIVEMRKQDESNNDPEFMGLLYDELKDKSDEITRKDEELFKAMLELEDTKDKVKEFSWYAEQYPIYIKKNAELEKQITASHIEFDVPHSLHEVLSLAESYWNNKILIHEEAYKSSNKYGHARDSGIVQEAWKMINKLAVVMYELKFVEQSAELESSFKARSGIGFSMTESKTTKREKKFVNMRTCTFAGKEITFFPHLKSSVKDDFRLHFSFLEDDKKILICHCGEHIDNARTRHME